jgi:hypothetical protein
MVPLLGTEFVPKSDFSETTLNFNTPPGTSLEATEAKARQVEAVVRAFPEVRYTLTTINTGNAQGKIYASIYIRLVDRKERKLSIDQLSVKLRQRMREIPGITVTHIGLFDSVGGSKQILFSIQGADTPTLERLTQTALEKLRPVPGLVDLDSSFKPNKPTLSVALRRDLASDLGLNVSQVGNSLRTLVAGQTVGRTLVAYAGLAALAASGLALLWLGGTGETSILGYILFMATSQVAGMLPLAVVSRLVPAADRAGGLAMANTISQIGAFAGPILWGVLADRTGSYHMGVALLIPMMAGAAAFALLVRRRSQRSA